MRIKLWYIPELIFNEIFSQVNTMEGVWIRLSWMYPSQTTVQIHVLVPLWETSQTSVVWWLLKILLGGKSSFSRRITFTLSSWCHIKRKLNNLLFIFFFPSYQVWQWKHQSSLTLDEDKTASWHPWTFKVMEISVSKFRKSWEKVRAEIILGLSFWWSTTLLCPLCSLWL